MPTIRVEMFPGRTEEQKNNVARRFTQVLVEETGAKPESVHVLFFDVAPSDWAIGGELFSQKQKKS